MACALLVLCVILRPRRHRRSVSCRASSLRNFDALEHIPLPVIVIDHERRIVMANALFAQLAGKARNALLRRRIDDIGGVGSELGNVIAARLHTRSGKHAVECGEIRYIGHACRPCSVLYRFSPLPASNPARTDVIATFVDITPIRNDELAARYNAQHLDGITANLPGIVYKLRRHASGMLSFRYVNGDTLPLFGLSPREMMADERRVFANVHPDDRAMLQNVINDAAERRSGYNCEFRVRSPSGERWIQSRGAYNPASSEDALDWDGYWIDSTDSHQQADALRAARIEAERLSAAQGRFLATMSHELRTPMSGIFSMLELLGSTKMTPSQHSIVDTVRGASQTMLHILDQVLDYSRIDADQLILEKKSFDLRELVEHSCQVVAADIAAKALQLRLEIDPRVAARLTGDALRIRQILLNLLHNAIKFTERGTIDVRIVVVDDSLDRQIVSVEVADTGIGIGSDDLDNVLEPFVQADASTSRRFGGSGLGLPICRQLARRMGGGLHLASQPGAGTTVRARITLPVSERARAQVPGCAKRRARVTLRDCALAQYVRAELTAMGMTVAVDNDAGSVDLHVTDELAARAEAARNPGGTAIVAVTERLLIGGVCVDSDLPTIGSRPFYPSSIRTVCTNLFDTRAAAADIRTSIAARTSPPRCAPILVADDQALYRIVWQRQLEELGYPYRVVPTGNEALETLCNAEHSMLITDLWMPDMNGFTLARRWRAHEATDRAAGPVRRLPIIGISANIIHGDRNVRCGLSAGLDMVLVKPLPLAQLQAILIRYLHAQRAQEPSDSESRAVLDMLLTAYGTDRTVRAMFDAALDAYRSQRVTLAKTDCASVAFAACLHDIVATAHVFRDQRLSDACAEMNRARSANGETAFARDTLRAALDAFARRVDTMRAMFDARANSENAP
ncbi:hypothetical protein WS68_16445 [Burkholderia sp. TSV86]|nr:hybrid sensor histidine kinase/response regulator [Burkholderia sp. TSV86]KVE32707.1 hypothetical protein WS68_16445 [Burkholderia sp. TSV86]